MKFTTLDEKEHLNQPIHCVWPLSFLVPALLAPPPFSGHTHTEGWYRGTNGSGNGLVFGAGGVGSPMIP